MPKDNSIKLLNTPLPHLTQRSLGWLRNDTWRKWSRPVRNTDRRSSCGRAGRGINQVLQEGLLLLQVRVHWTDGLQRNRVGDTPAVACVRLAHIRTQVDQLDVTDGQRQVTVVLVNVRAQRDHCAALPPRDRRFRISSGHATQRSRLVQCHHLRLIQGTHNVGVSRDRIYRHQDTSQPQQQNNQRDRQRAKKQTPKG